MKARWTTLAIVGLVTIGGCQNCGQAKREAEEAAAAAEAQAAEVAAAAEREAAQAAAAAEAQVVAEREAAEAAARAVQEEARRRHEVSRGDCLWCIAADRYGDGRRWPEIYEANRSDIADPDLIYPGQVFAVPPG